MNARTEPQLLRSTPLANSHLDALEEEAIFILREVAAVFERPTLLFMHHPPFATGLKVFDEIGL